MPPHHPKPAPRALAHAPCPVPRTSLSVACDGRRLRCVIPAPTRLLPQVFGIILVSVFAYDAFKIYRTEMAPGTTQGECLCSGERTCPLHPLPWLPDADMPFPARLHIHRGPAVTPSYLAPRPSQTKGTVQPRHMSFGFTSPQPAAPSQAFRDAVWPEKSPGTCLWGSVL